MGYTASKTHLMVGLGVSSIGDSWYGFTPNVKSLGEYEYLVSNDILPIFRGHIFTEEDQIIRKHILDLMYNLETSWNAQELYFPEIEQVLDNLGHVKSNQLVIISQNGIKITGKGRPFVRNICRAFDLLLHRKTLIRSCFQ